MNHSGKLLKNWLDSSLKMTGVELKAMFKFVDSVEGLKKVREAVIEVVGEESIGWLKKVSLWEVIFQKLIDERMMEIVSKQLEDMMELELWQKDKFKEWKAEKDAEMRIKMAQSGR